MCAKPLAAPPPNTNANLGLTFGIFTIPGDLILSEMGVAPVMVVKDASFFWALITSVVLLLPSLDELKDTWLAHPDKIIVKVIRYKKLYFLVFKKNRFIQNSNVYYIHIVAELIDRLFLSIRFSSHFSLLSGIALSLRKLTI
jgi:hypothetical protein